MVVMYIIFNMTLLDDNTNNEIGRKNRFDNMFLTGVSSGSDSSEIYKKTEIATISMT